jgi:hypothetical protein
MRWRKFPDLSIVDKFSDELYRHIIGVGNKRGDNSIDAGWWVG